MPSPSAFPNPACRTHFAFGDYWKCLVDNSNHCPHALGFGYIYLCKHPDNRRFAAPGPARQKCKTDK